MCGEDGREWVDGEWERRGREQSGSERRRKKGSKERDRRRRKGKKRELKTVSLWVVSVFGFMSAYFHSVYRVEGGNCWENPDRNVSVGNVIAVASLLTSLIHKQ